MSRSRNWFYTLNNYNDEELSSIMCLPVSALFHRVGKEVGDSGTPHLQGTLGFQSVKSLSQLRKTFSTDRIHFEITRDVLRSLTYCAKEGDYTDFGRIPEGKGKRNDLEAFKSSVVGGTYDCRQLRMDHSDVFARYPRFCLDFIRDQVPLRPVDQHPLREWQTSLLKILGNEPSRRHIIFLVDLKGNTGKSWFADWYSIEHPPAQVLEPGKKADMAYALAGDSRVLFMDCPRSKQGDFIQYDFLEAVKNGRVFSGKYESSLKSIGPCHVVVGTNEYPDMTKLSEDRYVIWKLNTDGGHTVVENPSDPEVNFGPGNY